MNLFSILQSELSFLFSLSPSYSPCPPYVSGKKQIAKPFHVSDLTLPVPSPWNLFTPTHFIAIPFLLWSHYKYHCLRESFPAKLLEDLLKPLSVNTFLLSPSPPTDLIAMYPSCCVPLLLMKASSQSNWPTVAALGPNRITGMQGTCNNSNFCQMNILKQNQL